MRYLVRDREGRELVVPSLADLAMLHRQGFLDDEDEVRKETSPEWQRVRDMDALEGQRSQRREPRVMGSILVAAVALAVGIAMLLAARQAAPPGGAPPVSPPAQRP